MLKKKRYMFIFLFPLLFLLGVVSPLQAFQVDVSKINYSDAIRKITDYDFSSGDKPEGYDVIFIPYSLWVTKPTPAEDALDYFFGIYSGTTGMTLSWSEGYPCTLQSGGESDGAAIIATYPELPDPSSAQTQWTYGLRLKNFTDMGSGKTNIIYAGLGSDAAGAHQPTIKANWLPNGDLQLIAIVVEGDSLLWQSGAVTLTGLTPSTTILHLGLENTGTEINFSYKMGGDWIAIGTFTSADGYVAGDYLGFPALFPFVSLGQSSDLDLALSQNGASVTLTATFHPNGTPAPSKSILFYEQTGDAAPVKKGSALTNAAGTAVKTFTSKSGSHSAYAKFAASGGIPEAISNKVDYSITKVLLVSPANGAIVTTPQPQLSWTAYADASGYRVQVSTSSSFKTGMREVSTTGTAIASPALDPGKKYYWRVIAVIPTGESLPSDAWKIIFRSGVVLVPGQPIVNGTNISLQATLTAVDTGALIPSKTITFYEKTGDGVFVSKGTAKTGSATSATPGVAVKTWKTIGGTHQAYASFKGDTSYAPGASDPAAVIYISYSPVVYNPPPLPKATQGVPYPTTSVATATNPSGGNGGPYHFELGTMGGFPPMGIILSPDGVLSGTCTSPPGTYKFTICAVDTAGNSCCKATSITVGVTNCGSGGYCSGPEPFCNGFTVDACCNTSLQCWYVVNGLKYCCAGSDCNAAAQTIVDLYCQPPE